MEQPNPTADNHELSDVMINHDALVSTVGGHYDRYILYTVATNYPGSVTEVFDYERQFYETYEYAVAGLPLPEGISARPTMPIPLHAECEDIVAESLCELQVYAESTDPQLLRDVFKIAIGDSYYYPPPGLTTNGLALFRSFVLRVVDPLSGESLTANEIEEIVSRPTGQPATQTF